MKKLLLTIFMMLFMISAPSQAIVLASWDFTDNSFTSADLPVAANTAQLISLAEAGCTPSSILVDAVTNWDQGLLSKGWAAVSDFTESKARGEYMYIQFSEQGEMDLQALNLVLSTVTYGYGPAGIAIVTSADGYANPVYTKNDWSGDLRIQIDLSGSEFQNTTNIEFRLYFWNVVTTDYLFDYAGFGEIITQTIESDIELIGTINAIPAFVSASDTTFTQNETKDIEVVIQNAGGDGTDFETSLSSSNANFTVHTPPFGPVPFPSGAYITNVYSVTASMATQVQNYGDIFFAHATVKRADSSVATMDTSLGQDVTIINSVFSSMDATDFVIDGNSTTNATLTVSNAANFVLSYTLSNHSNWLTPPSGPFLLAAGSTVNHDLAIDSTSLPFTEHTDTLTINYNNNNSLPNPATFPITLLVGSKVDPLPATAVITEIGGVNNFPGEYEPGEILEITYDSINSSYFTAHNVANSLSGNHFATVPTTPSTYLSLSSGSTTSTTYHVTISSSAPGGTLQLNTKNKVAGGSWSAPLLLDIYYKSDASASTNTLDVTVTEGYTTTASFTLDNAGNAPIGFSISDDTDLLTLDYTGEWQPNIDGWLNFDALISDHWGDTNQFTTTWENYSSRPTDFGFTFPFYDTDQAKFYVMQTGAIVLDNTRNFALEGVKYKNFSSDDHEPIIFWKKGSGSSYVYKTNCVITPFWMNSLIPTDNIHYMLETNRLVVEWKETKDPLTLKYQAHLYDDGRIDYLYNTMDKAESYSAVGIQQKGGYPFIDVLSFPTGEELSAGETAPTTRSSFRMTPERTPWITLAPTNGTLAGLGSQTITLNVDARNKPVGSYPYSINVQWANGTNQVIALTVNVVVANPDMIVPGTVNFDGQSGLQTTTNATLSNTGNTDLHFTVTDKDQRDAGYTIDNQVPFFTPSAGDIYNEDCIIVFDSTSTEEYSELIPIGFDFPYYGAIHSQFSIQRNGAISLGTAETMTQNYIHNSGWPDYVISMYTNDLSSNPQKNFPIGKWIPETITIPDYLIAPYWQELSLNQNSRIFYRNYEDHLIVTWENMTQGENALAQTFQVILSENGDIRFQYLRLDDPSLWADAVVGLRDTYSRFTNDSLLREGTWAGDPGTVNYKTNTIVIQDPDPNAGDWDFITNVVVTTTYAEPLEEEAHLLTTGASSIITLHPRSGSLLRGETFDVTLTGDASDMLPGRQVTKEYCFVSEAGNKPMTVTFTTIPLLPSEVEDRDGDGQRDYDELVAGTEVANANSTFSVNMNGSRTLTWPAPIGDGQTRTYVVEYTTSLTAGWTFLAVVPTDQFEFTDTIHNEKPVIYYRVTVKLN